MTNISFSLSIIKSLASQGLQHFVVCAGARNAPFIKALEKIGGIEVEEYFEERAAAFYAMGIAKAKGKPVAVVTTSGTAVANLYPAVMEAAYSGVPLVAITADRPASYRGTGAPQSVYQPEIFGDHVAHSYDLSLNDIENIELYSDCPVHINLCFDEPLIDDEIQDQELPRAVAELQSGFKLESFSLPSERTHFSRPLVILGQLDETHREFVKSCLIELGAPVYAEAHSGLREDTGLLPYSIQSGEFSFRSAVFKEHFDSVIRIGGVPILRIWRDLESKLVDVPVASFSKLPLSGLSRSEQVAPIEELPVFLQSLDIIPSQINDEQDRIKLVEAKSAYPSSEVSLIEKWAHSLPSDTNVLLGNSLPIREWELVTLQESKVLRIYSNRGVNGIDGLIATACGVARGTGKKTYVVLGDLSALYDLSSLALVSKMKPLVKVVIVNNGGGMIFRRLFNDKKFENHHDWNFSEAGNMFGLDYGTDIFEIRPDPEQSEKFWLDYEGGNK